MRRLAIAAVLSIAAAALLLAGGRWWLARPLPLPAAPWSFDVRPGASLRSVARDLAVAGVLPDERVLVALARWRGVDRAIKAGNYEVAGGITLPQLLDKLTQGDVTQTSLTVVEGSTYGELLALLAASRDVAAPGAPLTAVDVARELGIPGGNPEGWFFPDTYFFAAGSGQLALLRRGHELMRARLDAAWRARAADLPLKDPYEALILASIVEKETGRPADRPLVASVFVNRLRIGMRLQTDPTVIYGMGARFDGNLRRRDLETDTPYNTYTRAGLAAVADRAAGPGVDRGGAQSAAHRVSLFRFARRRDERVLDQPRCPQPRRGKIPEGRAMTRRSSIPARTRSRPLRGRLSQPHFPGIR